MPARKSAVSVVLPHAGPDRRAPCHQGWLLSCAQRIAVRPAARRRPVRAGDVRSTDERLWSTSCIHSATLARGCRNRFAPQKLVAVGKRFLAHNRRHAAPSTSPPTRHRSAPGRGRIRHPAAPRQQSTDDRLTTAPADRGRREIALVDCLTGVRRPLRHPDPVRVGGGIVN